MPRAKIVYKANPPPGYRLVQPSRATATGTSTVLDDTTIGTIDPTKSTTTLITGTTEPLPKSIIENSTVYLSPQTVRPRIDKQIVSFGIITPNDAAVPVRISIIDAATRAISAIYNFDGKTGFPLLATGRWSIEHVYASKGSGTYDVIVDTLD